MKNQAGGLPGAIAPFLTKTILPALGTLGLSAASYAISGATNKAHAESLLAPVAIFVEPAKDFIEPAIRPAKVFIEPATVFVEPAMGWLAMDYYRS